MHEDHYVGRMNAQWLNHSHHACLPSRTDLFITMTANLQWPEITAELLPGEDARNRPDLINRAFRMRLRALLHDVETGCAFGVSTARVHCIEFQKR